MIHNLTNLLPPDISKIALTHSAIRGFNSKFGSGLLNIPFGAFNIACSQRGEVLASTAGLAVSLITRPATAAATGAALSLIPGIGPIVGPVAAAIVSIYPNAPFAKSATKAVNWMTNQSKQIRHAEMGGSYVDTDYARAMRQRTLTELSGAIGSSRRFIGQEGLAYHR